MGTTIKTRIVESAYPENQVGYKQVHGVEQERKVLWMIPVLGVCVFSKLLPPTTPSLSPPSPTLPVLVRRLRVAGWQWWIYKVVPAPVRDFSLIASPRTQLSTVSLRRRVATHSRAVDVCSLQSLPSVVNTSNCRQDGPTTILSWETDELLCRWNDFMVVSGMTDRRVQAILKLSKCTWKFERLTSPIDCHVTDCLTRKDECTSLSHITTTVWAIGLLWDEGQ